MTEVATGGGGEGEGVAKKKKKKKKKKKAEGGEATPTGNIIRRVRKNKIMNLRMAEQI